MSEPNLPNPNTSQRKDGANPITPEQIGNEEEIIKEFRQTFFRGPMHPAVYEQIDKDHIHKIIDNSEKEDDRGFRYAREGRFLKYGFAVLVIVAIGLLTYFLAKDNTDLFIRIVEILVAFAGGIGTGQLLKRTK